SFMPAQDKTCIAAEQCALGNLRKKVGGRFQKPANDFLRGANSPFTSAKALLLQRRKHRRRTSLYLADDKTAECKSQNTPGPVAKDHKAARNASRYSI